MSVKILVTGRGNFGSGLERLFDEIGEDQVSFISRKECDIRNAEACRDLISAIKPRTVIHTAGITDVDLCELEKDLAHSTNVVGTRNLIEASEGVVERFVYISTDYVFDGQKGEPYTERDRPSPINYYGISKLEGEKLAEEFSGDHLIARVSLLFFDGCNNFFTRLLRSSAFSEQIRMPEDLFVSPTYSYDASRTIMELLDKGATGVVHITNHGSGSRYNLARQVLRIAGLDTKLIPVRSSETRSPAPRPMFSVLTSERLSALGVPSLRPWTEAFSEMLERSKIAGGR